MGVVPSIDISTEQHKIILMLLRRYLPETTAWVYGSRVKWTSRPDSDLDLVVFARPEQYHQVGKLREAFEESNLPFSVDLFVWDDVPVAFQEKIEAEHIELVSRPTAEAHLGWHKTRWGDIATLEYGRALRGYRSAQGLFRVYGTNGPIGWHDHALCENNGVIIGRKGAYRGVHYSADPFFVIDTAFYLKPKVNMNTRWAYYTLLTQDINGMDSGSAIPSTSRDEFYNLPVSVPPLSEQHAIAHILGTLDDKIELNRCMNETLEAMVRAIFKDWFVDFGPVRAKMGGQDPRLALEIYDLFPCKLDDGGKPVGWKKLCLGKLVTLTKGCSYKSVEITNSDTALVTLKSFKRGGGYREDGLKPYIGKYRPEQVVEPGEIVMALTDVTQSADVIGRPAIVPEDGRFTTLVASLDVGIVRLRSNRVGKSFVSELLRTERFRNHTYAYCTGTTVLHLSKEALPTFETPIPPLELVRAFENIVKPISDCVASRCQEIRVLEQTRDTLLPKLISGEIRPREAKKVVEALV